MQLTLLYFRQCCTNIVGNYFFPFWVIAPLTGVNELQYGKTFMFPEDLTADTREPAMYGCPRTSLTASNDLSVM